MNSASPLLVWSFAVLGVLVATAFPLGIYLAEVRLGRPRGIARRHGLIAAAATSIWLLITLAAAARGLLTFSGRPPTMVLLVGMIVALGVGIGLGPLGRRLAAGLPLAALVGAQGFRLPLELIMHRAYEEGLMPVQMSYSGLNFDILTGITAILVAGLLLAGRMPLWGVRLWNWVGFVLLINIMIIANLSTPTPIRVFTSEPANVWVTQPPFVWLPAVMVLTALYGHLVVFRRLRLERARLAAPAADLVQQARTQGWGIGAASSAG